MLLLIVFSRSIKILIGHGKRAKFMIAYLVHENIFAIQKSKKNISSRCKYEKSCSSFSPFKDILSNISASYAFGNALRKIPHMACRHQIYLMHLSFDNLALHHVWITQNHIEYNSFLLLIRYVGIISQIVLVL